MSHILNNKHRDVLYLGRLKRKLNKIYKEKKETIKAKSRYLCRVKVVSFCPNLLGEQNKLEASTEEGA